MLAHNQECLRPRLNPWQWEEMEKAEKALCLCTA